jgi:hypothetical protein
MYVRNTTINKQISMTIKRQSMCRSGYMIDLPSRDRAFDPHKCLNVLLSKLFTMMSGRCYPGKIPMQTDTHEQLCLLIYW